MREALSVCSLPRLRGRVGEGVSACCPLPVPPPQAGEGTMWLGSDRSDKDDPNMFKTCVPVIALVAILVASALSAQAQTQAWPQGPVRFILPFGPGAGADIGARLIQERLQARWGKPVVIENRPGGDSMIAIQAMLAANDDHTFLWGPSGSFVVHPYQYKKLPYDPDDLMPVARFSSTILGVGVPASMNIATLADFVQRARAEAGKFNSAAVPGITELAFDYF